MKKILFTLVLLAVFPTLLFASTYGKPYGSDDTTEVEKSDVKTIDQINRATEIIEEEKPAEEVLEPAVDEKGMEGTPVEETAPAEQQEGSPQ